MSKTKTVEAIITIWDGEEFTQVPVSKARKLEEVGKCQVLDGNQGELKFAADFAKSAPSPADRPSIEEKTVKKPAKKKKVSK